MIRYEFTSKRDTTRRARLARRGGCMLFVGHAESVWMPRLRWGGRWLLLGLSLGAAVDVTVRLVVG